MSGNGVGYGTPSPTTQQIPVIPQSGFNVQTTPATPYGATPAAVGGTNPAAASQTAANQAAAAPTALPSSLSPTPAPTSGIQAPATTPANVIPAGTPSASTVIANEFANPSWLTPGNANYTTYQGYNQDYGIPQTAAQWQTAFVGQPDTWTPPPPSNAADAFSSTPTALDPGSIPGMGISPTEFSDLYNAQYNASGVQDATFTGNPLVTGFDQSYASYITQDVAAQQAYVAAQQAATANNAAYQAQDAALLPFETTYNTAQATYQAELAKFWSTQEYSPTSPNNQLTLGYSPQQHIDIPNWSGLANGPVYQDYTAEASAEAAVQREVSTLLGQLADPNISTYGTQLGTIQTGVNAAQTSLEAYVTRIAEYWIDAMNQGAGVPAGTSLGGPVTINDAGSGGGFTLPQGNEVPVSPDDNPGLMGLGGAAVGLQPSGMFPTGGGMTGLYGGPWGAYINFGGYSLGSGNDTSGIANDAFAYGTVPGGGDGGDGSGDGSGTPTDTGSIDGGGTFATIPDTGTVDVGTPYATPTDTTTTPDTLPTGFNDPLSGYLMPGYTAPADTTAPVQFSTDGSFAGPPDTAIQTFGGGPPSYPVAPTAPLDQQANSPVYAPPPPETYAPSFNETFSSNFAPSLPIDTTFTDPMSGYAMPGYTAPTAPLATPFDAQANSPVWAPPPPTTFAPSMGEQFNSAFDFSGFESAFPPTTPFAPTPAFYGFPVDEGGFAQTPEMQAAPPVPYSDISGQPPFYADPSLWTSPPDSFGQAAADEYQTPGPQTWNVQSDALTAEGWAKFPMTTAETMVAKVLASGADTLQTIADALGQGQAIRDHSWVLDGNFKIDVSQPLQPQLQAALGNSGMTQLTDTLTAAGTSLGQIHTAVNAAQRPQNTFTQGPGTPDNFTQGSWEGGYAPVQFQGAPSIGAYGAGTTDNTMPGQLIGGPAQGYVAPPPADIPNAPEAPATWNLDEAPAAPQAPLTDPWAVLQDALSQGGPWGGVVRSVLMTPPDLSSNTGVPQGTAANPFTSGDLTQALAASRADYLQQVIDDPSLLSDILGFGPIETSGKNASVLGMTALYNSFLNRGVGENLPELVGANGGAGILQNDPRFFPRGNSTLDPAANTGQANPETGISTAYYPGTYQLKNGTGPTQYNPAFDPATPYAFMNSLNALAASLYGSPLGGLINDNGSVYIVVGQNGVLQYIPKNTTLGPEGYTVSTQKGSANLGGILRGLGMR